MTKIIVADIDGTLVVKGTDISKENAEALNRLLKDDYLVGLASGRQTTAIDKNWQKWGLIRDFDFYIGMNGAMLKDVKKNISIGSALMNFEQIERIYNHLNPLHLATSYYGEDDVNYLFNVDEEMEQSITRNPSYKYQFIQSLEPLRNVRIYRVMFRVAAEDMEKLQEYVKLHPFDDEFTGFRTHPLCYEVMLKGVSKASALTQYCQMNQLSLNDTYAFGDTSNDVEMLKVCHGVCLCDGTKDALAASEFITQYPCNESGFAKFINSYFYNEGEEK